MKLEQAMDELFGAPLATFTKERDRLAKELAASEETDAATAVKALKKPSVSTWAVNQLARVRSSDVDALVTLHEELEGAGDAKELRRIQDARKKLISGLSDAAATVLEDAGHSAASATMQRVAQTLLSASSGDDLLVLRKGRLTHDLESSGFGAMSGFEAAADSEPFRKDEQKARARAEELSSKAAEAEAAANEARRLADSAQAEVGRLVKEAERAEKRAEQARSKADAALDRLE